MNFTRTAAQRMPHIARDSGPRGSPNGARDTQEPLITRSDDEREGYVPNVVHSCGALIHRRTLVLPYRGSDSSVRFALVDPDGLLWRLRR